MMTVSAVKRRIKGKRGYWEMPVWLIWMLIALVVLIVIIGIASGKMGNILNVIENLFRGG
mgnify:CR=1 FL=1